MTRLSTQGSEGWSRRSGPTWALTFRGWKPKKGLALRKLRLQRAQSQLQKRRRRLWMRHASTQLPRRRTRRQPLKQQRKRSRKDSMKLKRRTKPALTPRMHWMPSQRGHSPHSPRWRLVQLHHRHQWQRRWLHLHPLPRWLCNQLQCSSPKQPWLILQACWAWLRRLCGTCFHLLAWPHLRPWPHLHAGKSSQLLASQRPNRHTVAKWPRLHAANAIIESLRIFPESASPGMLRMESGPWMYLAFKFHCFGSHQHLPGDDLWESRCSL